MNAASKQHHAFLDWQGLLVAGALAALPAAANAQAALTLHGGWRTSSGLEAEPVVTPNSVPREVKLGDSSFAMLVAGWAIDAQRELELQFSHQRTELFAPSSNGTLVIPLTVQNYQIGGTNFWEGEVGRGPYVAGGVGFSRLAPEVDGYASETRPSLSVALGYQWLFGGLALRTEARANFIVINSSGGLFCSGGCVITVSGNTLTQLEASVGLGWRF